MPRYHHQAIDPDTALCSVAGYAINNSQHSGQWHSHNRIQLLYISEGSATLELEGCTNLITPMQAVWLPPGQAHKVLIHAPHINRSLYFDRGSYPTLPRNVSVIEVGPLLRELILRMTEWTADLALEPTQTRLVAALLDELAAAPLRRTELPMPTDSRLLRITHALLDDPGLNSSLEEWGLAVGASARTLARLFLRDTGLTFLQWRTQCRLWRAHSYLAQGASVTEVAHRVGYASDSAFIAMYRRVYRQSPGKNHRDSSNAGV
jgi:AraC-like DNA-binding protein